MLTPTNIITVLIALNFLAFFAFGIDKARAERGQRRICESTLLKIAAFGGTFGAYAGRSAFRHKTCKQPFSSNLAIIAWLQAGVGLLLIVLVVAAESNYPGAMLT